MTPAGFGVSRPCEKNLIFPDDSILIGTPWGLTVLLTVGAAVLLAGALYIVWKVRLKASHQGRPSLAPGKLSSLIAIRDKFTAVQFAKELDDHLRVMDFDETVRQRLLDVATGRNSAAIETAVRGELKAILQSDSPDKDTFAWDAQPAGETKLVLVAGVNGSGKTSTCAKLAQYLKNKGKSVMLVAGDTFRAGAIDQLRAWGKDLDVEVYARDRGSDPVATIYEGFQKGQKAGIDVVIVDTSGRLDSNWNLMKELTRIEKTIKKLDAAAPHECFLILDGSVGLTAKIQASRFADALAITGMIATKLDGSTKGGALVSAHAEIGVPIRFICVGDHVEAMMDFDAFVYTDALMENGDLIPHGVV